jgi:hypothetical protein
MIAPLRPSETETASRRRRLHHAHHLIASTLLPDPSVASSSAPRLSPWKAWLFVAWAVVAMAAYAASMLAIW